MVLNFIPILNRLLKSLYIKYRSADVDSGGCGFIANFLYQELVRIGYQPKIIVITKPYDRPTINAVDNLQKLINTEDPIIKSNSDINSLGVSTAHIMLFLNNHYIDLSGCYDSLLKTEHWSNCTETLLLTPEILKRITSIDQGWNDTFDRRYLEDINEDIKSMSDNLKLLAA